LGDRTGDDRVLKKVIFRVTEEKKKRECADDKDDWGEELGLQCRNCTT